MLAMSAGIAAIGRMRGLTKRQVGFAIAALAAFTMALPLSNFAARVAIGAAWAVDRIPDLGGHWAGEGLDLFIDTNHQQGNADPAKPFNRQPYFIRNVTGQMVVFVIGADVYFARMDDSNTMVVSRGGRMETYTLKRARRR